MHIGRCSLAALERWTCNRVWRHPPSFGARPGTSCWSRDTSGACALVSKSCWHQSDLAITEALGNCLTHAKQRARQLPHH